MSAIELEEWICPHCEQTNYYHPPRCHHCAKDRRSAEGTATDHMRTKESALNRDRTDASSTDLRKRIIFLSVVGLALVTWIYLIWQYRKWDAQWGSINVLVPTLLAALVLIWKINRLNWFHDRGTPTRLRFMIIPIIAFILCAGLGIYFTEPIESGGSVTRSGSSVQSGGSAKTETGRNPDYQYDYGRTRAGGYYLWSDLFELGGGAGDVAGGAGDLDEGCLVLLLVLLVIALIIGSVVIPHFWALATFLFLVIMAMVAYREWRFGENYQ
jgi:hypothetical protein